MSVGILCFLHSRPDNIKRAYLCCLFALLVVVSPLQVLISALPSFFNLFWLTIHLYQSPIFFSASVTLVELLLSLLLMTVTDNKASGIVAPLIFIYP